MKKKYIYFATAVITGTLLLGGCTDEKKENESTTALVVAETTANTETTTVNEQEKNEDNKAGNKTKPVVSVDTKEYDVCGEIYKNKSTNIYYYFDGEKMSELAPNDFGAKFDDVEGTRNISFKWFTIDNRIHIYADEAFFEEFTVVNIEGNTEAVVLEKTISQEGKRLIGVCRFKDNKIEVIYDNALKDCMAVSDFEITADLKTTIFATKELDSMMIYEDGKLSGLAKLCGEEDADLVNGFISGENIIIYAQKHMDDDEEKRTVTVYTYDLKNKSVQKVKENIISYLKDKQSDGIQIVRTRGYSYEDGKLCFYNMADDKKYITQIEEKNIKNVDYINESLFGIFLNDGSVQILDADAETLIGKIDSIPDTGLGIRLCVTNGKPYAVVPEEGKYSIYTLR